MDRRYRSGDLPVVATTQQVQHCFDHAFTLQTETDRTFCPRAIVVRSDDEDQYSQQLNAKG
jgi:hypothetical protein